MIFILNSARLVPSASLASAFGRPAALETRPATS